jgi:iron complex outermembrane receptor protein
VPKTKVRRITQFVLLALGSYYVAPAFADDPVPQQPVDLGTIGTAGGAGKTSDVFVGKGTASAFAPTQANLTTTEPQSIISRAFIEDSVAPTGNFNTIVSIAPSVVTVPAPNGPGLGDTTSSLRGFQDGFYNVTWDGIPFGDTNNPTHHSTAYFPAAIIGGVVIERGPGNASNLGQSTFGGSINLLSKTPSATPSTTVYGSVGTWNTNLEGAAYESGRMVNGGDATLQLFYQHLQSDGYLTYNTIRSDNFSAKYQRPFGDSTLVTLFGTFVDVKTQLPDSAPGATLAQVALFGKNYSLNNDPADQGYWGYNRVHKQTDMEYFRAQTDWGSGWQSDNNLYTYAYDNRTIAGADGSGYLGTGVPVAVGSQTNTGKFYGIALKSGVPGYDKLNEYRVVGDILKVTDQTAYGLLRFGIWTDWAETHRHNWGLDVSTLTVTGDETTKGLKSNQNSSWFQYQPFVEFEWAAGPGWTVTPGLKYVNFDRKVDAIFNQGSKVPADYSEDFTATLPFLTINKRWNEFSSSYFQFAKGMSVPSLGDLQVPTPANTVQPQYTTNYQLGYVFKSEKLVWDADVYVIDFNNMEGNNVINGQTYFFNAGGAQYKGVEGEVTYVVGSGFAVFANASINDAKYNNNTPGGLTGDVPLVPDSTYAAGVLYNEGPLRASLIYKQVGKQYAVAGQPSQYLIPSYGNLDLNATYTWKIPNSWLKTLSVQGSVFNVANTQKVTLITPGSTVLQDLYEYQPPRSYMLTVRGVF